MSEILFVNACVRENSRTKELATSIIEKLTGNVNEVDLYKTPISPLGEKELEQRSKAAENNDFADKAFDLAKQFANAEYIVIAAPYWDLLFPAVLRTYLEAVSVAGITFKYTNEGRPQGLCKAKKVYYVTTAGGFIGVNNFGFDYVKAISQNLYGINEVYCFTAEGLDIDPNKAQSIMDKAKANIDLLQSEPHTIPFPKKYGDDPQKDGASSFAGITDHCQSRYYVSNDFYNMKSDKTLHILNKFETYQQTTEYTCGAVSALMVLNWFGSKKYHERAIAQLIETHSTKGSTVENIADLFNLIGWNVESHSDINKKFETVEQAEKFIIDYIDKGIPIMVDWVDWAGHWQVLIGIDTCGTDTPYDDVLIFADPYDVTDHKQDGYYTFPLGRFFGMWREGPCIEKTQPYQQPFVVAWPKNLKEK